MAKSVADLKGMLDTPVRIHKQLAMDGQALPKGTSTTKGKSRPDTSGYEKYGKGFRKTGG